MSKRYKEYIETPTASIDITPTTSTQTIDVTEKATANVAAMPSGTMGTVSASKSISGNTATITPSISAGTAGYNTHTAASGAAVTVQASELVSGTLPITTNGEHDVTNYQKVNVSASKPEETFTVTPTTSQQTITPSEGHVFSSGTVEAIPTGTQGDISLTKTIANNTATINANQTDTTGYIEGSTKTGSTTVTASELVSGSLVITTNGNHDVTNYATAAVSIPERGGDYNVISTENPDGSQNLAITDAAGGGGIESLTVTTHGTYTKSSGGYNPVIVEDANLAAGNIKKDISIFGVTGTFEGGITPTGTITTTPKITSQTIDVTNYATNIVNSIYEEINTAAGMDAINIDANIGKMYKYTGTTTSTYLNGGLYIVEQSGFTVNVTISPLPTRGGSYTKIKFNSAPTSENDCDAWCTYGDTPGTCYDGAGTYTGKNKVYIWKETSRGSIKVVVDGQEYTGDNLYTNPIEVTLTQDCTINIKGSFDLP